MQILNIVPECQIVVTTKDDDTIDSAVTLEALLERHELKPQLLVLPKHAHATHIRVVDKSLLGEKGEFVADGLCTNEKAIALAHRFADCVPVIIVDRKQKALMALHAGWRGLTQGIVTQGLLTMQAKYHSEPENLWLWIGPCIQAVSYVQESEPVQASLPEWEGCITSDKKGWHVDLPKFILGRAGAFGIDEMRIMNDGRDTYTETETFFSYRYRTEHPNEVIPGQFVVAAWLV